GWRTTPTSIRFGPTPDSSSFWHGGGERRPDRPSPTALTAPVPSGTLSAIPQHSTDKGTPGKSRGRKATGPRSPPRRRTLDATKDPKTAELPNGELGGSAFSARHCCA